MSTIFSKIINKEIPSFIVYEDDIALAFLDAFPESNGHILIIPKKFVLNIDDISNDTLIHIIGIARNLKNKLENKLNIDGLTLSLNNGEAQHIKHFHLHLIPYYKKKEKLIALEEIYNKLK